MCKYDFLSWECIEYQVLKPRTITLEITKQNWIKRDNYKIMLSPKNMLCYSTRIFCFGSFKGVLHPWTLFLKTLSIFSKDKAILDKVCNGSD